MKKEDVEQYVLRAVIYIKRDKGFLFILLIHPYSSFTKIYEELTTLIAYQRRTGWMEDKGRRLFIVNIFMLFDTEPCECITTLKIKFN